MSKYSLILTFALTAIVCCNGFEYTKTEFRFDTNDIKLLKSWSHVKRRIVRGVFFYTYDDNLSGKQIEMHELSLGTFNKLISSSNFTKSPATIKSTFDLVSFFDGRCEASISCERIKEECTSRTPDPTTKPTTETPIAKSWKADPKLYENFSDVYIANAPIPDIKGIKAGLKDVDVYTSHWTTPQVNTFLTPFFEIIRGGMQNTTDLIKLTNRMIKLIGEFDPDMDLEMRKAIINDVSKVSNIAKRDVFNVSSTNSTTTSVLKNKLTILPTTSTTPKMTSRVRTTTKTRHPSTTISTSTSKPSSTTKTYIPPPASSRKPYTRWIGSYRKYSGYYSFGYSWRPFTGGNSWRTRRYSTETTTTTARYQQDSLDNSLNPIENSV